MKKHRYAYSRLLGVWAFFLVGATVAINMFPPQRVFISGLLQHALILLVGLLSFEVFRSTVVRKYKFVFVNFFILGCVAQPIEFLSYFASRIYENDPFAGLYAFQYLSSGVFLFWQVFCIWFCCLQLMLKSAAINVLYILTFCLTGTIFFLLFFPFLQNPKYMYTRPEITDFRIIDRAVNSLTQNGVKSPSVEDVAAIIGLSRWNGNHWIGELTGPGKIRRIEELFPYVRGQNYETILIRPLLEYDFLMNLSCIMILGTFFVFQYLYDPPQPGYVEKMMFVLMLYSTFQVFHFYAFSQSVEIDHYLGNYNIGAILSALSLVTFVFFLNQRLKFVLSIDGQFYDRIICDRPMEITRWRDKIDNSIILYLFNTRELFRRFVTKQPQKGA